MSVKIIPRFREKPKRRSPYNKIDEDSYKKRLSLANPSTILVGKYIDMLTPTYHKCLIHNYYWKIIPSNALKGHQCLLCKAEKTRKRDCWTNDKYLLELKNVNDNIIPLEKYKNMRTPIWHWFKDCGHLNRSSPMSILRKGICLKCSDNKKGLRLRKTHDMYVREVYKVNPFIEVISHYTKITDTMTYKCKLCGLVWTALAHNVIRGSGCPICCLSHGEREISRILNSCNIPFTPQYTFKGLIGINGGELSYDFFLPNYNYLVEFQGEQHERPAFGIEQFEIQQEHDKRKREYAKEHGYKLIEIWYYDYDRIEEILTKELNIESVETVIKA